MPTIGRQPLRKATRSISGRKLRKKKIIGEDVTKGQNSCMQVMEQLNRLSGNLLSGTELGQVCKDIQKISNQNLSVPVSPGRVRPRKR